MSQLLSMAMFSLLMSISPGPVNVLALSTGVQHGFFRSLQFVSGATVGFVLILLLTGLGIGAVVAGSALMSGLLKYAGCAYLLYIGLAALKCQNGNSQQNSPIDQPSFMNGCFMQWLNPKAWTACVVGCSTFEVYDSWERLTLFSFVYFFICFIGISVWALLGRTAQALLGSPTSTQILNRIVGLLMCGLAVSLLFFD